MTRVVGSRRRDVLVALVAATVVAAAAAAVGSGAHADPIPPQDVPAAAPAVAAPAAAPSAATAGTPAAVPSATTGAASGAELPINVEVKAEPDEVTIGTPFRFTVEVTAPTGMDIVMAQPTEHIGDFDIIDFGTVPSQQDAGMTTVGRWYRLAGYSTGYKEVESPPVYYRPPHGELVEVPKAHTVVTVKSLLPENADGADIRDIKGPEPLPIDWRPYYLVAGAVGLLVVVALLVWRFSRRGAAARALPPVPPHTIAYADLERLRGRHLIEQGAFKEYYSTLSDIVRTYLERRFDVRAPEMTTEEFLATSARNGRLQRVHRDLLGDFLTESDLVKFARHVPTIADSERAYDAAKRFIDETRAPDLAGNGVVRARDTPPPPAPVDLEASARDESGGDAKWRGPHAPR